MPKNSQQDQKQARQKKNSKGAQAQGTQCRDRDRRQSSDPRDVKNRRLPIGSRRFPLFSASPGILSLQVRPVLLSASFPSPFPKKGCGHACHPSPVPGIG